MWDIFKSMTQLLSVITIASALLILLNHIFDYKKLKNSMKTSIREVIAVTIGSVFNSNFLNLLNLILNYGLYKDYLLKVKNKKIETLNKEFAVTELVIRHNSKNNTLAYIFGGFSILAYIVGIRLNLFQPNYIFQFLTILMILIVFIKQKILQYRLKKGYFGTNEYELRQILRFIADEKNKDYFKGDGKGRKIFSSAEDTAEFKEEISEFEAWGGKV
ncbi:hypothetical protein BK744_09295 [Bacillus thuringiensis serovar zhaodongensis]|uniref:hypothetical protein n=1 Tax=Bacillus thuringiensis TaxID=1428 RepID=UPI000A3D1AF6|nr:hypothetical protein [Bacillus thuringiensis]OUB77059.1 hypothetical protein BK744_09295 [Bacillus thuringiensis serovar zhaodongensis]